MTSPYPDLAEPLREAIVANAGITALLPAFLGSYPVFTRRPPPKNTPYPMIIVTEDLAVIDLDGIRDFRPMITRGILTYANNDTPEHSRVATTLGWLIKGLFQRNQYAITVPGWSVTQILTTGPAPTFTDDQNIGVAVNLNIELATLRT